MRVNRSREITTGEDKEWFLEAIAVATRYLANTKDDPDRREDWRREAVDVEHPCGE